MAAANPPGRPTWAEVDLSAILANYRTLASLQGRPSLLSTQDSGIIPVIKADAYGHGAVPVARALAAAGAKMFAVAIVEEGVALRLAGIDQEILILEGAWPGQEREVVEQRLLPAVHSVGGIRRFNDAAEKSGRAIEVHLKIDTGMTRLGIPWDHVRPVASALRAARNLHLSATFTHLSSAEDEDPTFTREQMSRFEAALGEIVEEGMNPGFLHVANSAGLLYHPELGVHAARPGIALYGYPPSPERCRIDLRPALSLKSRIGRITTIPAGEPVGYNRRFIATEPTRVATLPVGYADGYPRALSGRGRVIIGDRYCKVLGTVSMDMIAVDVTHLPEALEGDEALLLGSSPRCRVTAEEWALETGTIPYEILCGISPRVPRHY